MSLAPGYPLEYGLTHCAPPYGIWEDAALLSVWQDNEYNSHKAPRLPAHFPNHRSGSVHALQQRRQSLATAGGQGLRQDGPKMTGYPLPPMNSPSKRTHSVDDGWRSQTKRPRTNSEPVWSGHAQAVAESDNDHATQMAQTTTCYSLTHAHPRLQSERDALHPGGSTASILSKHLLKYSAEHHDPLLPVPSPSRPAQHVADYSLTLGEDTLPTESHECMSPPSSSSLPSQEKSASTHSHADQGASVPTHVQSMQTPESLPTCGAESSSDEIELLQLSKAETSDIHSRFDHELPLNNPEPVRLSADDQLFIRQVKTALQAQGRWKTGNVARRQARRIGELLEIAQPPNSTEALILSIDQAATHLESRQFFPGPIITDGAQQLPLQTTTQFLDEFYDNTAKVWIQDPGIRLSRNIPHAREISIGLLKQRFIQKAGSIPWNCLEMATHVEDGLRPTFLNGEDCRLLTKLKIPSSRDSASRRGYEPGWKEVEKWALLAQGGALTEPHQDSHGYSTYITMNQGTAGFGWLSNPTESERLAWRQTPAAYTGGRWRYVVLSPGQTVFFPSGTVHFVFRLRAHGDTLAFGGHVLRCSQIVRWVEAMLEEKAGADITNEELTVSAPAYLDRVERFVKQAINEGKQDKWGGKEAIERFLQLKEEFGKAL